MADAGFDQSAAVSFWAKMCKNEQYHNRKRGGRQSSDFQSAHPHVSVSHRLPCR